MRAGTLLCHAVVTGAVLLTVALPALASNGTRSDAGRSQVQAETRIREQAAAIGKAVRIFNDGVTAYVFENVRNVPWNEKDTTTPIDYAPIDVYAGSDGGLCSFQTGPGTAVPGISGQVNLQAAKNVSASGWNPPGSYLPSGWSPPLGGTFCATVWLNKPVARQYTMMTYFVTSASARVTDINVTHRTLRGLALQASQALRSLGTSSQDPFWTSGKAGSGTIMSPAGQPVQ